MGTLKDRKVRITEAKFDPKAIVDSDPITGKASPTHHTVWVGSDEEGWVQVPHVTNVSIPLRQGAIRKAIITVILPEVDFKSGA